jgi:uncharacterized protein YkwD
LDVPRLTPLRLALPALLALLVFVLLATASVAGADTRERHAGTPAHRHACASGARSHHHRHARCRPGTRNSRFLRLRAARRAARAARAERIARERAAAVSAALADPCAGGELQPSAENLPLVRQTVLCLVNRERAQHGETPLRLNPSLQAAAEEHCAEMIAADYFEHVSPSGLTPAERIREDGYVPSPSDGYVIGENLAWGTYSLATPQATVAAWIASPGHLANILEARYTETGVAVTPSVPAGLAEGAPGATWAQEFGVIVRP